MRKLGRFFRVIAGVFCALLALGGAIAAAQEHQPGLLILAAIFLALSILLLRRKKAEATPEPEPVSVYAPDAPEDILQDMRRYYTGAQTADDVRIMQESLALIQQTTSIDTFSSRLQLTRQKALTLLQAGKAGCKGLQPGTVSMCEKVLDALPAAKVVFLNNSYLKETNDALLLKTPAGQRKRLEAYLAKLEEHRDDFVDVQDTYDEIVQKTKDLIP